MSQGRNKLVPLFKNKYHETNCFLSIEIQVYKCTGTVHLDLESFGSEYWMGRSRGFIRGKTQNGVKLFNYSFNDILYIQKTFYFYLLYKCWALQMVLTNFTVGIAFCKWTSLSHHQKLNIKPGFRVFTKIYRSFLHSFLMLL